MPHSAWECPWCGLLSDIPAEVRTYLQSRRCNCGALAFGAPPMDSDEIIDTAISVFGIADGYLTEFDSDRMAGLRAVGVEIAEGRRIGPGPSDPFETLVLWFRQTGRFG